LQNKSEPNHLKDVVPFSSFSPIEKTPITKYCSVEIIEFSGNYHLNLLNSSIQIVRMIMKNKSFFLAGILTIAVLMFAGCGDNQDNAKNNVEQANQDMIDAQAQFEKEWQQFKSDAEIKINDNQEKIDDFKVAMKTTSTRFKAKYENEVLTLEQKNIELKKKLNDFKYERKENWDQFRIEFSRDVDTVVVALNDIFTKKE
jgi:hypothetical protein